METKFGIGDHLLMSFEVREISIDSYGQIRYTLTADYSPYDDVIVVEEGEIGRFMEKEIEND